MGFRTILVPIEQHDLMSSTLETALCLAQKFDSYMEGFALRVAIPAAYAMADATAVTIPKLEQDIAENAKQTRGLFETFMQEHGVPCGAHTAALSSKWLEDAPEGDDFVGSHGRLFDVIVLGRPGHNPKGSRMGTLEAALFESGRPVWSHRRRRGHRWVPMFWLHGIPALSRRAPSLSRCRCSGGPAALLY